MKKFLLLALALMPLWAMEALVTPEWLAAHQNDPKLRIIEVSDENRYEMGHIPGAMLTTIGAWRVAQEKHLVIRAPEVIEAEIRRLGIDTQSSVVLYAPISEPKDLLKASYIFWALNYHGIGNVAILDGGLSAWEAQKRPLETKASAYTASAYKVALDPARFADAAYVKSHIGTLPMLDARPGDKYLGITPTAGVTRNGHIQGAMSYSWNYSVDGDYRLKNVSELATLFKEGYGLQKEKEVLVYCTGGLETSFNYFVLSGVLGYKNVRLYDASMKEWGNRTDTPMTQFRYESFSR